MFIESAATWSLGILVNSIGAGLRLVCSVGSEPSSKCSLGCRLWGRTTWRMISLINSCGRPRRWHFDSWMALWWVLTLFAVDLPLWVAALCVDVSWNDRDCSQVLPNSSKCSSLTLVVVVVPHSVQLCHVFLRRRYSACYQPGRCQSWPVNNKKGCILEALPSLLPSSQQAHTSSTFQ